MKLSHYFDKEVTDIVENRASDHRLESHSFNNKIQQFSKSQEMTTEQRSHDFDRKNLEIA